MGLMGSVFAVSTVVGPLLGGWFVQVTGWRWLFAFNIPLALLAIAAMSRRGVKGSVLFGILGGAISIGRYLKREARTPLCDPDLSMTCHFVWGRGFPRLPHFCVDKDARFYYNHIMTWPRRGA